MRQLPAATWGEYTRRMTAVAQAGGYVSFDAFQKLESLLLECERAVVGSRSGRDSDVRIGVRRRCLSVVLSNDSLPADDDADDGPPPDLDAEPHG